MLENLPCRLLVNLLLQNVPIPRQNETLQYVTIDLFIIAGSIAIEGNIRNATLYYQYQVTL